MADALEEILEDLTASRRMGDFGVELKAVQVSRRVLSRRDCSFSHGSHFEAGGRRTDIVAMAHPRLERRFQTGKQLAFGSDFYLRVTIFTACGWTDLASKIQRD